MRAYLERAEVATLADIDWEQYSSDLLSLLDLIEITTDDVEIVILTHGRFDIAVRHGFTVVIEGPSSGVIQ